MEKTKKGSSKQQYRREKNVQNKEKPRDGIKQRWQNKQQIRLNLPYYIYNGFEHNQVISDRDKKLLQHARVPKVYISNVKDPKTWSTLLECMSRNDTIISVTIIDVDLTTTSITPAHLILQGPPSIRELIIKNNNKEENTMSLSNFHELFKALNGSKTMERIGLFGSSPGNKIKPDLLSISIDIAPNIKSYSLDYDWYEPCMLQTLRSAKHVTELSLSKIHYNEDLSELNNIIPQLTKLELCFWVIHDISPGLVNAKKLTSLHIEVASAYGDRLMDSIMTLKNQLRELSIIIHKSQAEKLGEFLTNNNTLTKLEIIEIDRELCSTVTNALKNNTTLNHLKLNKADVGFKVWTGYLGPLLQSISSLKTLQLIDCMTADRLVPITSALECNTSLTELSIQLEEVPNRHSMLYSDCNDRNSEKFCEAIESSKTLKILNFDFRGDHGWVEMLLEAIQNNQSLRQVELNFMINEQYDRGLNPAFDKNFQQKVLSVLQTNKNLEYLKVNWGNIDYAAHVEVDKRLNDNYVARHTQINQIATVMKMVALRPNLLGPHLPLEVWCLIFSFIELENFTVDCAQLFMNFVAELHTKN